MVGSAMGLLLAGLVFVSPIAGAYSTYNAVTIVNLAVFQPPASAGVLIVFTPNTPADTEGCTTSGVGYAWIDLSATATKDAKAMYAAALAAQIAGKQITVSVSGCSAPNYYPLVYSVTIIS